MISAQIPEFWTRVKLKEVTQIVGGGTPSRSNDRYFGGDILWATPTDVTALESLWINSTKESITEEGLRNSSVRLLPPGTVLMTSRATIGETAISGREICTNQGFANFICNPEVLSNEYLAYWLRTVKRWLYQLAMGTTFKEISKSTLSKVQIPLPPLPEQERIVRILREADDLRRQQQAALTKAQDLIPALFHHMFGDPATNPKGWATGTLGDVIWAAQDGPHISPQYSDTGVPFLSTRNIRPGKVIWDDVKFISQTEALKHWKKCKPEYGDILYTKGGTTGLAKAIDFDTEIAIWVHLALLKTNHDKVDPLWLESMLNTKFCHFQSQRLTRGITNQDLGLTRMVKIKIFIPPPNLQREFSERAKLLKVIETEQYEVSEKITDLIQSTLLTAFSGDLTETYRLDNREALETAANKRDALLGHIHRVAAPITEEKVDVAKIFDGRSSLAHYLSQKQQTLLQTIVIYLKENGRRYFNLQGFIDDHLELSANAVRQNVELFEKVGLLTRISLQVAPEGIPYYETFYRFTSLSAAEAAA